MQRCWECGSDQKVCRLPAACSRMQGRAEHLSSRLGLLSFQMGRGDHIQHRMQRPAQSLVQPALGKPSSSPILGDKAVLLLPGSSAMEHPPVQLLPPDNLVPFLTPFRGVGGPLCGGAATCSSSISASMERQSSGSQASPSAS